MDHSMRPWTELFAPALLLGLLGASACGMRTPLVDLREDAGAVPDGKSGSDGPADGPSDGPALSPDGPADRPDLPSERLRDVAPEIRPDLPPDRASDPSPDRRAERVSDLAPDGFADLARDTPPDGPGRDLPDPRTDGPCSSDQTVSCVCDNGLTGHRICLPNHIFSECGCGTPELMRVRDGVIGTWTGTATTPWLPPYGVTFTFDSYSHYSASSLEGTTPALYYGTDMDSPEKHYAITNIQANGNASGYLDIYFAPGSINREPLQEIMLSADGTRLQFWFMKSGAGPLEYDLQRSE